MKSYIMYFEIYGKKMKATIQASSRDNAESILRSKLKINKVQEVEFDGVEYLKNVFNLE